MSAIFSQAYLNCVLELKKYSDIITPMGKASRSKKVSINEVLGDKGRHEKKLKPPQESPSKVDLQKTSSIMKIRPIMVVLLVAFAVYFNALFGDFVYDDHEQIVNNQWIRDIGNIPTIFTSSVWSFKSGISTWNYYRPLMHIVYMLNYHVFGLNPWGFHLVNILFHCGASVLVFLIIRRFLTERRVTTSSVYLSPPFLAALLFASHPIHTEAVTWIAGLPEVAFTFFYLLSFYLYILFRDGSQRGYLLSLLSFSIATLFKEPALTLPIMLIAYDYQMKKFDETLLSSIKRYIPFIVVSGVYLSVRYFALGNFVPQESYANLSAYQFIINIFPLFREYLTSLLWPFNLTFWHTFHPISTLVEANGVISLVVTVIFIVVFALAAYKKNKIFFIGLLLLIVPLLPAFYIKGISGKPFAERYLYLPSVGYVLLLAILLSWVKDKLPNAAKSIAIVFIIIAGSYTVGTISRNNVWEDDFHLWSDTVEKSPDSIVAHNELAQAYASRGQLDRAIAEVQKLLLLEPASVNGHVSLGKLYEAQGEFDSASAEFQTALRLKPDSVDARNAISRIGKAYISEGQLDKAMTGFQSVMRLRPDDATTHIELGKVYASQGRFDKAIAELQAALRLKPDSAVAHIGIGNVYTAQGQLDRAIAEFQTALRLKPDSAIAHFGLGNVYTAQGQLDKAIAEFQTALRLKPDFDEARKRLNNINSKRS